MTLIYKLSMIKTIKDYPGPHHGEFNQLTWVVARDQTLLKVRLPVTPFSTVMHKLFEFIILKRETVLL